jgi:hypothetical protein
MQLLEPLAQGKAEAARLLREGLKTEPERDPAAELRRLRDVLGVVGERW